MQDEVTFIFFPYLFLLFHKQFDMDRQLMVLQKVSRLSRFSSLTK